VKLPPGISQPLLLGKGAEGDVYRAWQEPPGRVVVLKRSRDAEGSRRLGREARLLSSLAGMPVPGLLSFEAGVKRSTLVLEWLEGVSLDALEVAVLSEAQRRSLLLEACRAVAKLHGAGIVHGDLSRANLLAHARGGIEVVDLGVARKLTEDVPTGLGAWEVVAPEALHGQLPTQASDVYALGCLALQLWEAVPVRARDSRTNWCEMGAAGELALLAKAIHPQLENALDPAPSGRPPDAKGLLELLQADWTEILWPGREIQESFAAREGQMLEAGVAAAIERRDWDDAWRFQKMRVELATDPEPLLGQLSRLSRRRMGQAKKRWVPWAVGTGFLGLCLAGVFLWQIGKKPSEELSLSTDTSRAQGYVEQTALFPEEPGMEEQLLPYAVGPQPPDTRLWIDGQPEEMPEDDTVWMEPGDYRFELRDASGNLMLDTLIRYHPRKRGAPQGRVPAPAGGSGFSQP
jgi:serine/threonine protein kinase